MPHPYDTHHRDRHLVGRIAGRMPAPESVRHSRDDGLAPESPRPPVGRMLAPETVRQGGTLVPFPHGPATAASDAVTRSAAVVPLDHQNRFAARKAIAPLGWTSETRLVLTICGGDVVISPGTRTRADLTAVSLDTQGRLTLPARVLVTLGLQHGDALFLVGLPQVDELRLYSAAAVARLATGAVDLPEGNVEAAPPVVPAAPVRPTRIRAAFQPESA